MTAYFPAQADIEFLSRFLTSSESPEGSLDYLASHGYLCAVSIACDEINAERCLYNLVGEIPKFESRVQKERLISITQTLINCFSRQLYLGDEIDFPISFQAAETNSANDLTDWCFGFMEAVGDDEELWFRSSHDEARIAELILPISILSEPYVEAELQHLVNNHKKKQRLADEILDNLQQLYLEFRS